MNQRPRSNPSSENHMGFVQAYHAGPIAHRVGIFALVGIRGPTR
jgi:hypothetical protein